MLSSSVYVYDRRDDERTCEYARHRPGLGQQQFRRSKERPWQLQEAVGTFEQM